jgi:hypothetical protein
MNLLNLPAKNRHAIALGYSNAYPFFIAYYQWPWQYFSGIRGKKNQKKAARLRGKIRPGGSAAAP